MGSTFFSAPHRGEGDREAVEGYDICSEARPFELNAYNPSDTTHACFTQSTNWASSIASPL